MGVAEKTSGAPLPAKLAGLLREAKWLILVAVAGYLLLIFATFHRGDPGWSRSVTDGVARNAGGVIGYGVGELTAAAFGFTGATLVLLTLAAIGLSLFTGISWIAVAEVVGAMLEAGYGFAIRAWDRRRDRKLGARAREERDFVV